MQISELSVGNTARGRLVVADAGIRQTKNNPPRDFLTVTLSDGLDTLDGKIWNYQRSKGIPEQGKVYDIVGIIGEYMGKKQITLEHFELSEDQDLLEFLPRYPVDAHAVYNNIDAMISTIKDLALRQVLQLAFEHKGMWLQASSAKGVHHVGVGGNLAHTWEVAQLADHICDVTHGLGYQVDRDLCVAGALLHDIGKLYTYQYEGATVTYTRHGREVDHIVQGIMMLDSYLSQVEELHGVSLTTSKLAWALRHIIASHHGEKEYGSPVTPLFMEAYIVNFADGISATLATLQDANRKAMAEGKAYTDRIYTCHGVEHILQTDVLGEEYE